MDGLCPISHALMRDPVIASDGHTYDRSSIEQWLATGSRLSPMTTLPLASTDLIPNILVRQMVAALPRPIVEDPADASTLEVTLHTSDLGNVLEVHSSALDPPPIHIVAAVDVSGSMGSAASDGDDNGVSLLDLVKKCMEMLIHMLRPNDRLSLISYSTEAKVLARREFMTAEGKTRMMKRVNDLAAGGMTNYFGSLEKSFELCEGSDKAVVFNFTDGCPNVKEPPRGYTHALTGLAVAPVYAFGFGNAVSSSILVESAMCCHGRFIHIPTVNFVGTCFGHAIANVRETLRRGVAVRTDGAADLVEWRAVSIKNGASVALTLPRLADQTDFKITAANGKVLYRGTPDVSENSSFALVHVLRAQLVELLLQTMRTKREKVRDMKAVQQWLAAARDVMEGAESEPYLARTVKAFCSYFEGDGEDDAQVLKAMDLADAPYWDKWGKHYVSSLYFALRYQECHNFKDEGVQGFGGVIFEHERDKASALYMSLPAIKPSRALHAGAHVPVSTHTYHCRGGCFHGDTLVTKVTGALHSSCPLHDIVAGDLVVAGDGSIAEIECLLHTPCLATKMCLVRTSEGWVYATPYHPVSLDGGETWTHPKDMNEEVNMHSHTGIYSFLLKTRSDGTRPHSVLLEGCIAGISLAHGLKLSASMRSEFWDTELVAEEMKSKPGFKKGVVVLDGYPGTSGYVRRDRATGLVIGFQ